MRRWILPSALLGFLATASYVSFAQASPSSAKSLQFDVVSIHPASNSASFRGMQTEPDSAHVILPLKSMVALAYGMRNEFVFGGPAWGRTTPFEVFVKTTSEADIERLQKMSWQERGLLLKPILEEKFGLKAHRETRKAAVYELIVVKGGIGPQLKPIDKPGSGNMAQAGNAVSGNAVNMEQVARVLSIVLGNTIGRPIVDKTGLAGTYDLLLRWSNAQNGPSDDNAPSRYPDIFTALQEQLGLKLQPAQDQVQVVVIDSAHLPEEN